jgi:N-acetylneuraminic acid mutarotase
MLWKSYCTFSAKSTPRHEQWQNIQHTDKRFITMQEHINVSSRRLIFLLISSWLLLSSYHGEAWEWEILETKGKPTARHEAAVVAFEDQLYLLGGRGIKPVDRFDPKTNTWKALSKPPIEIHHFQPVVYKDAIYLVGAMTGKWPIEQGLESVLVYYPKEDRFEFTHEIPKHRRRGGAGAVLHNSKIYLVGGITNGHNGGYRSWTDEYDPETGKWRVLPDAPHARDHFQAVAVNSKLYAFAGRRSSTATDEPISLVVEHGNVFNFETEKWESVYDSHKLPTLRAGTSAFGWNDEILIGGGESKTQEPAHNEVEAFNIKTNTWRNWPSMTQGRHGSGFAIINDYVYTASGSLNRGGGPELNTIERLKLPSKQNFVTTINDNSAVVFKKWHTLTINVEGPETSETNPDNPFLNYRLMVTFKHDNVTQTVRGYYAADGKAEDSGTDSGNVWQVKFKPPKTGKWQYEAILEKGENIAVTNTPKNKQYIKTETGEFHVIESDRQAPDFRASGQMIAKDSYFYFPDTNQYWMKGGTNSPENLLAFEGIDGTYRLKKQEREGEAVVDTKLHQFDAHLRDWKSGDPTFRHQGGKALFGAMNYLANKGMNTSYFLVFNINGDGNDVWPYADPRDFTRFDVSRLAQWDQLFQHMQNQGIMLHLVTQETENERLLDEGDVGPKRTLFYQELIARFGYHLALTWNLGEENGYAEWAPPPQDDHQRKMMIDFFSQNDPYDHPILLHTHSQLENRKPILDALLGYPGLDGLSLQQEERAETAQVISEWKKKSQIAGNEWLITMDEIGKWDLGATTDTIDPGHQSLRGNVLWGSLLSGAAGVEWYFGAQQPHNDLTSEDWRQRDQLWNLTKIALDFFNNYIPWWNMASDCNGIKHKGLFCLRKKGQVYALYLPNANHHSTVDLNDETGTFTVKWYNPREGGELIDGSVTSAVGGKRTTIGKAPNQTEQDWVLLLTKDGI